MDKYTFIYRQFKQHEDKKTAAGMAKYMRDQFSFYGLPTPKRKALYKEFLKQEKKVRQDRLATVRCLLSE